MGEWANEWKWHAGRADELIYRPDISVVQKIYPVSKKCSLVEVSACRQRFTIIIERIWDWFGFWPEFDLVMV